MFGIADSLQREMAEFKKLKAAEAMSVSTHSQNLNAKMLRGPNVDVTSVVANNGRTVKVVEVRSPAGGDFYCYDVVVINRKGDLDVVLTTQNLGEALQAHYRSVTKFGGPAKPKTVEEIEAEKLKMLDELIEALNSDSVQHGKSLAEVEAKKKKQIEDVELINKVNALNHQGGSQARKSKATEKESPVDASIRWAGIYVNANQKLYDILDLKWRESAVDACKALALDSSEPGRVALALQLGYRGNPGDMRPLNAWLHKRIIERYGPTLEELEAKVQSRKNNGPVLTPIDWDEHMKEVGIENDDPKRQGWNNQKGKYVPPMNSNRFYQELAKGNPRRKKKPNREYSETIKLTRRIIQTMALEVDHVASETIRDFLEDHFGTMADANQMTEAELRAVISEFWH